MKKKTIMKLLKYLYWGISWGCTFFVLTCLIGYFLGGRAYLDPIVNQFPRHAAGSIIVGIACGSTSIVYTLEKLSHGLQIVIHFTVGNLFSDRLLSGMDSRTAELEPGILCRHWYPELCGNMDGFLSL